MRIVVFGYSDIGYSCLKTLIDENETIAALITHRKDPKENIWFKTPDELAKKLGIPCFYDEEIRLPAGLELVKKLNPDIIFSFYYRKMIPKDILDIPQMGAINLHGSYLPKYRGKCPINWVIINGETETGVTLHYMVEKPDAGDIIAQKQIGINMKDTALDLHNKVKQEAVDLLRDTFPSIKAGTNKRIPQDESQMTYFSGRKPEDGRILKTMNKLEVYNLIRAVTVPYPGAFTFFRGKKLTIWESDFDDKANSKRSYKPGYLINDKNKLYISVTDGILRINKCQLENSNAVSDSDFLVKEKVKIEEELSNN